MNKVTLARLEARVEVLKAMAHPSRLFILEQLSENERCVNDLTEMIGSDMSTVSKHLSYLQSVGLVASEKRGTQVFYSLKTPCILKFMECVEAVLKANVKAQLAVLE